MNNDEKVQLVWDRFVFQSDHFAVQKWNEKRERYEFRPLSFCPIRCGTYPCEHAMYIPLEKKHVLEHLRGDRTIGVYCTKDNMCSWLCLDMDTLDQNEVLTVAKRGVDRFGMRSLLVEFSGARGYHIWLFFATPVPTEQARLLGHYLLGEFSYEIYPRQGAHDGIGNLVKLPLGIQQKTGNRCWFVDQWFNPHPDQWQVLRDVKLIDDLGPLPEIKPVTVRTEHTIPCISNMMQEGLYEGSRDRGLWRLGNYWREHNIPFDFALLLADEVNTRSNPPLPADQVEEKMRSSYGRKYSAYPCHDRELDAYCSADCYFFGRKAESRGLTIEQLKKQVRNE